MSIDQRVHMSTKNSPCLNCWPASTLIIPNPPNEYVKIRNPKKFEGLQNRYSKCIRRVYIVNLNTSVSALWRGDKISCCICRG